MNHTPTATEVAAVRWTSIPTALGDLRLVATGDVLTEVDFDGLTPCAEDEPRSSLRAVDRRSRAVGPRVDDDPLLIEAAHQFTAYFNGGLTTFALPLAPRGTGFQQRVWAELQQIPYGEVTTYGAIAARLGMTGHAARAVGAANGANPIAIAIPCHRVVGAGGKLTGYAAGLPRKQRLLALEQHALL